MLKLEWIAAVTAALMLVLVASVGRAEGEQQGYFEQSVTLEGEGKYQEALDILNKITGPQAHNYIVELRRGWLAYMLADYDGSTNAYARAVRLNSDSVEAKLGLMLPQLAARKWVDAEKSGLSVIRVDPENYLANSRLAYVYYNLTRYRDAASYYARVIKRYPGDLEMRSGYAWSLFMQRRQESARVEFKKILAISPSHKGALKGIKLCP
jgi:tetratricopeptide (TPR) repeat protein